MPKWLGWLLFIVTVLVVGKAAWDSGQRRQRVVGADYNEFAFDQVAPEWHQHVVSELCNEFDDPKRFFCSLQQTAQGDAMTFSADTHPKDILSGSLFAFLHVLRASLTEKVHYEKQNGNLETKTSVDDDHALVLEIAKTVSNRIGHQVCRDGAHFKPLRPIALHFLSETALTLFDWQLAQPDTFGTNPLVSRTWRESLRISLQVLGIKEQQDYPCLTPYRNLAPLYRDLESGHLFAALMNVLTLLRSMQGSDIADLNVSDSVQSNYRQILADWAAQFAGTLEIVSSDTTPRESWRAVYHMSQWNKQAIPPDMKNLFLKAKPLLAHKEAMTGLKSIYTWAPPGSQTTVAESFHLAVILETARVTQKRLQLLLFAEPIYHQLARQFYFSYRQECEGPSCARIAPYFKAHPLHAEATVLEEVSSTCFVAHPADTGWRLYPTLTALLWARYDSRLLDVWRHLRLWLDEQIRTEQGLNREVARRVCRLGASQELEAQPVQDFLAANGKLARALELAERRSYALHRGGRFRH